ncbi:Beta-(1--_2)glucan export ATP-binding/permease protein NdvA [Liberibacter crescens BT-1]|uniref:Beta-(1-->2)glucan export ATP-binding/permease protein NdvA n=1 Tax=Liberibacter crescens (strain BT-1) TaxID=1215343 RepID=L0EUR7_LIBCB|nr:glucan ABC transporter ATP-binding protein/ permease [Liberibacter crescens]AGA64121.1 Beta-(1-->2)glucan export ATP-binding/permease protein NdvA [Liberibacter crescens BT-1]AMC12398.1 cyclic beta-1,2-glucan ABC transporter [Liberibacter crescens]
MSLFKVYICALTYLSQLRLRVFLIVLCNVILAVVSVAEPILFGSVIDNLSSKNFISHSLLMWMMFMIFNALAFVLVSREADRIAHSRRSVLLTESFARIISRPLSWHYSKSTFNLSHTLLRASETLFTLWLEFMRNHLATAIAIILLIPVAFSMDFRLATVLMVLGLIYWLIGKVVINRTRKGQDSVESHYRETFSHISDSIRNVSVLHSYDRIDAEVKAVKSYCEKLLFAQLPVLDWWALANALNRMASTISMVVVIIVGSFLVKRGEMQIGEVIAFIGFANLLISRLDQVRQFSVQIFEAHSRLIDFFELEGNINVNSNKINAPKTCGDLFGNIELGKVRGLVEFRDVSFNFQNAVHGVKKVSFVAKAGQTIAIVGPTGAGKTTLMNLLQRVYDPNEGQILIDGIDITRVTHRSLRRNIATVFQESGLLDRSISENISLGREEAKQADIVNAASVAVAHDFIKNCSDGYDTRVGEKGNYLSGGERQRIAIARAVLKDAPILILDEATSALDVETENRVKNAIDVLRNNRTTFIIAHRLSTVREADLVMVVDKGQIVEMGSFEDLSHSNGRFAALLRSGGIMSDINVRKANFTIIDNEAA